MKSFTHHAYSDTASDGFNMCSRECFELPLMINCAGFMNISVPFCTYNDRGREDFYLMYLSGGSLAVTMPEGDINVGAGDFIIFPPRYQYKYRFSGDGSVSYYFAHFTGSFSYELMKRLGFTALPSVSRTDTAFNAALKFEDIFTVFSENSELRDAILGAKLQELLCNLVSSKSTAGASRIKKSVEYLNSFYTEEISVPSLAKSENLSVSRYNAVFKEAMGASPIEYVTGLRIKHACTLLNTTDMTVGQIGETVGYTDKYFFSKIFKKRLGISPRSYRDRKNIS